MCNDILGITDVSTDGHGGDCGCGSESHSATPQAAVADAVTSTFQVSGMTCAHCVAAVTDEVSGVAGVSGVQVDLASGVVTVTGDQPVQEPAVRAAVEEAGYELVPGSLR